MKPLGHFLNAVSVLVPDFLWLSLIAAVFFGLYGAAKACGFVPGTDPKRSLEVALALAYLIAIVVDAVSQFLSPPRTRPGMPVRVIRPAKRHAAEALPNRSQAPSVEQRVLVPRP